MGRIIRFGVALCWFWLVQAIVHGKASIAPEDFEAQCATPGQQNEKVLLSTQYYSTGSLLTDMGGNGLWLSLDFDSPPENDEEKWRDQSQGKDCEHLFSVCGDASSSKWMVTQYINISQTGVANLVLNMSVSTANQPACMGSACSLSIQTYETNELDEAGRSKESSYSSITHLSFEVTEAETLQEISEEIGISDSSTGLYVAIIAPTSSICVMVSSIVLFHYICPEKELNLVKYPEDVAPASRATPSPASVEATCVDNADPAPSSSPTQYLECTGKGVWSTTDVSCECNEGFFEYKQTFPPFCQETGISITGIFYNVTTNGGFVTIQGMVSDEADPDTLGVSSGSCEEVIDGSTQVILLTSEMASTQLQFDSFAQLAVTTKELNGSQVCKTISLGNLTIKYVIQQQPNKESGASVEINITCNWGISIGSILITSEEGTELEEETCSNILSFKSKIIEMTCSQLDDDTSYNTSIEAMVQIDNETYPLYFSLQFRTEAKGFHFSSFAIALTSAACFIVVFISTVGVGRLCLYIRSKRKRQHNVADILNVEQVVCNRSTQRTTSNQYAMTLSREDLSQLSVTIGLDPEAMKKFESLTIIANSQLELMESVGKGEFGVVYKGHFYTDKKKAPKVVAVKTLQGIDFTRMELHSFLVESLRMDRFSHLHVLGMLGVCLDAGPSPYIVLPFMSGGSLLSHMRKRRSELVLSRLSANKSASKISMDLTAMSLQIAKGMEYLAGQKFIHRDLAARNCMIDENGIIKVADFGLAKDIYEKMYFREGKNSSVKLPYKWMALESLQDGLFFREN